MSMYKCTRTSKRKRKLHLSLRMHITYTITHTRTCTHVRSNMGNTRHRSVRPSTPHFYRIQECTYMYVHTCTYICTYICTCTHLFSIRYYVFGQLRTLYVYVHVGEDVVHYGKHVNIHVRLRMYL